MTARDRKTERPRRHPAGEPGIRLVWQADPARTAGASGPRKDTLAVLDRNEAIRRVGRLVRDRRIAEIRIVEAEDTTARADTVAEPQAVYAAEAPSAQMPGMIEAMMPSAVPTAPAVLQARRNSAARADLMEEFGLLTSAEVAELAHSEAENRAALASRWRREERIFSAKHRGKDYFPAFQLDPEGQPREVIATVLEALGGARGWQTALWFTGANGYLDGRRPVDLLESEPDAVVEAAEHEGAEVYF